MIETKVQGLTSREKLESMVRVIRAQTDSEKDPLAQAANATAIMDAYLDDINWIGFYIMRDGELVLGPFQGRAACTRIKVGQGVCGTSVQEASTMLVPDVDAFPGHIICDSASRSEVVVPVFHHGTVIAVLDCDSPSLERFTASEAEALEKVAALLAPAIAEL